MNAQLEPPRSMATIIASGVNIHHGRVAIATMDDSVTYAQLHDLIINFAARMRHHGVGRGACVDLQVEHPAVVIALAIACGLLGCAWTRRVADNDAIHITHSLHDGLRPPRPGDKVLAVDPSWSHASPGHAPLSASDFVGYRSPTDTWTLMHSSGTTGSPKFMALSEVTVVERALQTLPTDSPAHPVLACLFPPLSMIGIQHWLATILRGGTIIFADPRDILGRVHIDYVLGAPNNFLGFLDTAPAGRRQPGTAIVGGAPASKLFFTKLLQHFAAVRYVYGANESSILAAHVITEADTLSDLVHVGCSLPFVTIQIVDEDGTELPAGQEGIVRHRTPWQVAGYVGDPATTAEVFRDGWVYPGDLGFKSATGELSITGRVNDQLNVGGSKLNPKTIDDAIMTCPGVNEAACFAKPNAHGINRLVAAITIAGPMQAQSVVRLVMQRLHETLKVHQIPTSIYVLAELPRTDSGKLMRRQLVDAVQGVQGFDVSA